MEAGALSALIEDRPNMRGPVGDRNVFVTSSRIYSVLRAVVGDDAPTFPDVESRREFLSAALGRRVEFLGETVLRAKFWYVPVRHPLTSHWFGVLVKNGEQSEGFASQASGGRVGMISLDCLRDLRLSPALVDLKKKRVFRRIGLFATELFKEVRGCEPKSWLRFLNSISGKTVIEVTVPQQLGKDSLHLCGDHVLSYLIMVLRLQTFELESLFQSHSSSPPMLLPRLLPERGPTAQDLRKRLDSLIGAASEVTRSNEAPQSPLCLGPTESDVMCNLPPFPTLQAPQSGRHRRPGGESTETKGFGGEIQSGRTAEIAILGRTGGVMGRELDAVKERFLMALHEREEVDRMLRECTRDLSTSLSILGRERPQSLQMAGVAVPALIPRAPVLTNGDAAMTQAEHLVLSALRIAEAKESAMATAGKLPDLSVPDPSPGSAALSVTVSARSLLLCPRSAGCTTQIVAQGESLAESATRMAIEEEMIESEQEEGLMGWLGSYQSGHSIDSDGLARLAPGRWLNDSAMNFFGRVITFLGAEFESSSPLTFVNSVVMEMMKLIDIEAMQRTKKAADWQVERERGKATGGSTGSRNVDTKWKEREADLRSWWVHRLRRMGKRFKPYGGKDLFCVFNHSDAHWLAGYVKGGEKGAVKENETLPMLTVYTLDSLPPTQISIPGLLYPFFKATACGDDLIGGDDDIPMQAYALTVPCQRNGYDCGPHILGWLITMITGIDFQEVDHAVAARVRVALRNVVTYVFEEPRWWAEKRGRSRVWGVLKGTLGSGGSEPAPP
uniref:Ubiquitin-like protease family profile domain-containing protein n=1 Tax=Chromera velia CCMP2878 TaxID=1169474 RepID=A0A0G4FTU6_9ALVE|eukprot:Cvel_18607.t1-p1 / transcript=Cvel_18607.t1 / gene=Cvel_18607 / organism=Chromera_velia_CCMP2878 / gene_product=hypothetical protein / transcript_product=hypothetical protein / location=Cvel_scaffold1552:32791-36596(-) / protein_length=785 / sequence_SO=supercontig / SO=protein_coding / is_pseudo=false